jgi:hypothetical protein
MMRIRTVINTETRAAIDIARGSSTIASFLRDAIAAKLRATVVEDGDAQDRLDALLARQAIKF